MNGVLLYLAIFLVFIEEKTKGHWDANETNDLWIYTTEGCESRPKVIAFDMGMCFLKFSICFLYV